MEIPQDGKKRIQQLCQAIRQDTLEPAQQEASRLIAEGEKKKQMLIAEGQQEKERLIEEAQRLTEQERQVFEASIAQASQQAVESLTQQIESKLFNEELEAILQNPLSEPKVVARLIEVLVQSLEKESLGGNLQVEIAKNINANDVNQLLAKRTLERLTQSSVQVGNLKGGVKIQVLGKNMHVSLTLDDAKQLLAQHLRKGFRQLIFASE